MREVKGDLWDYHTAGYWIGITTNGYVNRRGEAVMGRGIAEQAAKRFPGIKKELGDSLKIHGNLVLVFADLRLYTFPVKHIWNQIADLDLIVSSCQQLATFVDESGIDAAISRPGCGNGRLDWEVVWYVIEPILGNRVLIVDWSV